MPESINRVTASQLTQNLVDFECRIINKNQNSISGMVQTQLVGRIVTLCVALILHAEAVSRIAYACLFSLAKMFSNADQQALRKMHQESSGAYNASLASMRAVFQQSTLTNLFYEKAGIQRTIALETTDMGVQTDLSHAAADLKFMAAPEIFDPNWKVSRGKIGELNVGICEYVSKHSSHIETLTNAFSLEIGGTPHTANLFGLFESSKDSTAAHYLKTELQKALSTQIQESNPEILTEEGVIKAINHTVLELNTNFVAERKDDSGCAATFVLILNRKMWTVSLGNTRSVLENGSAPIDLSKDHGMAAAFGNTYLNEAASIYISHQPIHKIAPRSHLILGSEGVFELTNPKQIVNFTHENRMLKTEELAKNVVYSVSSAQKEARSLACMIIDINEKLDWEDFEERNSPEWDHLSQPTSRSIDREEWEVNSINSPPKSPELRFNAQDFAPFPSPRAQLATQQSQGRGAGSNLDDTVIPDLSDYEVGSEPEEIQASRTPRSEPEEIQAPDFLSEHGAGSEPEEIQASRTPRSEPEEIQAPDFLSEQGAGSEPEQVEGEIHDQEHGSSSEFEEVETRSVRSVNSDWSQVS